MFPHGWKPQFDIGIGFSQRNMGSDRVVYLDEASAKAQPRDAVLGLSCRLGLSVNTTFSDWEIASITLAREAEDILVENPPPPMDSAGTIIGNPPPPQYLGGAGSIQILNNIILGKQTGEVTIRSGIELGLAELAFLRAGSIDGPGASYTTIGYGIRLAGVLKTLEYFLPSISSTPVVDFTLRHVDIRFDYSSSTYDMGNDLNEGIAFSGLSLLIK